MDVLTLAVIVLAAYRITAFLVADSLIGMGENREGRFASPLAERLDRFAYKSDGGDRSFWRGKLGDLLTCRWCLGFWVAVLCYAAWTNDWPGARTILTVFAVAGAAGYLGSRMNA